VSGWFWTMMAATVTGTVTTLGVLWVCRWRGIAPLTKVWFCRLALLKWPVGLFVGVGVSIGGAGVAAPSWVAQTVVGVFVLWVAGVVLGLAESVLAWWRCRRASMSLPSLDRGLVLRCATKFGVSGEIDLRRSPHAIVMLAPHRLMTLPDGASEFVVLHELAHFRHRDLWWSGLASLVQCAFWFHPLVEVLHREMRLWQDVAADQRALAISGVPAREAADEIMSSARPIDPAPVLALSADARLFARRFSQLYGGRPSLRSVCAGVVLTALLAVPILPSAGAVGEARRSATGEVYVPSRSPVTRIATIHSL
jgi:beta-lactamase regulating signal transducer with metallopeptidase domain